MIKLLAFALILIVGSSSFADDRLTGVYTTCSDHATAYSRYRLSIVMFGFDNVSDSAFNTIKAFGNSLGEDRNVMLIKDTEIGECSQALEQIGCIPPEASNRPAILIKNSNPHCCIWFDRISNENDMTILFQRLSSTIKNVSYLRGLERKRKMTQGIDLIFDNYPNLESWRKTAHWVSDFIPEEGLGTILTSCPVQH